MAKILVVDDAAFMRLSIRKVLTDASHEVFEAQNGSQAVAEYIENSPDVVTMDITMPEMDGIEALKKIREHDPDAKVIMISALGQESKVREAILAGARDFVVKPFEADRVIGAVNGLLD